MSERNPAPLRPPARISGRNPAPLRPPAPTPAGSIDHPALRAAAAPIGPAALSVSGGRQTSTTDSRLKLIVLEVRKMAAKRVKPIEAGTAGILGTFIFLLAWIIVERVTDTGPKSASRHHDPCSKQGRRNRHAERGALHT